MGSDVRLALLTTNAPHKKDCPIMAKITYNAAASDNAANTIDGRDPFTRRSTASLAAALDKANRDYRRHAAAANRALATRMGVADILRERLDDYTRPVNF